MSNANLPSVSLVGHCLPDTSYLKMTVLAAFPDGVNVATAHTPEELQRAASNGALLLVNRALEPGFATESGLDLIETLRREYPQAPVMLISNFPESQAEAVKLGALPGFGKRELGTPRVKELLRGAVVASVAT